MNVYKKIFVLVCFLISQERTASCQGIINPGFESVTDVFGTYMPDNWHSLSGYGMGADSLSYSGTYSLAVWNWYFYAPGIAVNGTTGSFQSYDAGTPYTSKAHKLTGYYYFEQGATQSVNDTGFIAVLLKKYNSAAGSTDTVGYGILKVIPGTSSGYLPFEVNITDRMPGTDPDSVVVHIQSSYSGFCDSTTDGTCLYLYIDDLALESPDGITSLGGNKDQLDIFPNPAEGEVNFSWNEEADQLSVYSIEGKLMYSENVETKRSNTINLSFLNNGLYLISLENENGEITRKKIIIQK